MSKSTRRGYAEKDEIEFGCDWIQKLSIASQELNYLLDRGYPTKGAATFIGNHYMLSERQRLAIMRAVSSPNDILLRKSKHIPLEELSNTEVHIDAFNTIITLEVALSNSLLLECMDSTIRDLAGLRGTYHVIDKTEQAIHLLFRQLWNSKVGKVIFYIDSPVSNSGRLKSLIMEISADYAILTEAIVLHDVDKTLETKPYVITSDAIILNKCLSWVNLNRVIINEHIPNAWYVKFPF
ncbi:DUF434 domain-containing protein [Lachnoclostridium phytofermentans]|uniref:DUF434 domain-containing protein n=1 Tax=Lachnoclostridium phytofermentans (strain ATCC 700394 / DSM 18823 / ISDg) TaxID=357809 RepID=A9KIG4_LACP7|nr:DUF434 domain-containing protein [Lachnoclostridium phytofermentans]ABX42416.1 protein of unknown function DUF434 [Lachnoclostridium phytofermentans ISDg]